jgi:hypothetical protein
MSKMKAILIAALMAPVILISVSFAEENNLFRIYDETRISSIDMDCNYVNEDHGKYHYNFEYPKLIITDDSKPLITFVDEKSKKLIFAVIANQDVNTFSSLPIAAGDGYWREWPIVFSKDNKIYIASIPGLRATSEENARIKVFLLDKDSKTLHLYTDKPLSINKRCSVSGIHQYSDKFTLVGKCNYVCWRYLPHMLMTTNFPVFYHNVSFLFDKEVLMEGLPIEEEGCFTVRNDEYVVSKAGVIYGAWVRDTKAVAPLFDQMIYYSISKDGIKWGSPVEIYSLKDTKTYLELINMSLAGSNKSAFLLWQDFEKGIYFAELYDEKKSEITKISDSKKFNMINEEPLVRASTVKVASDTSGNAYVLWTQNNGRDYQLFFKARINGQWSSELIINKGTGFLKLPDMKVDKDGFIHITYIKSMDEHDLKYGKYGCYYMKLEKIQK